MDKPLTGTPDTVEIWMWLPRAYGTRGGTFIGNYGSGKTANFAYEIQYNGTPRFWVNNGDGTGAFTYHFSNLDTRRGEWVHVAFVHDYDPANTEPVVIKDVFNTKSFSKNVTTLYEVGQVVDTKTENTGNEYHTIETVTTKTVSSVTETSAGKYTVEYITTKEITKVGLTPGVVHCYIDGVRAESFPGTFEYSESFLAEYCYFGGDRQAAGQTQRFNGYVKEMRIYEDARTPEEIASDYAGNVDYEDENFVLHYELDAEDEFKNITDLTGNGNDATYTQMFYDEVLPVEDYAYSLAVVGDTQTVTVSNADKLKNIYQWILDNKDEKKIQYVIGLGDITEKGEDWGHKNNDTEEETAVGDAEWAAALEAISMMDGKIPYSLIRGAGHDGRERFNEWFGDHEGYTQNITGYYKEGRIENVYHTFKIGSVNYMILCLDFGAKDDVLAWANELVASHPSHRVIVTTHAYLEKDGSLLETGEAYCPSQSYYDSTNNDGDDLWNKFVRKHANICMVMCGHMTADSVVTSTQIGDHGNVVRQILIDPQGLDTSSAPRGMVAMLYFSADGKQVDVQYYSTITDMYRPSSEFTVSYGATEAADYDTLGEGYLVVQDQEDGLYSVVENDYFRFLGGALRYTDATAGSANIRFGYLFDADFDLAASEWKWDYGVAGSGLASEKAGTNKSDSNRTNLVITGVPTAYFAETLEVRLSFKLTVDGVEYTAIDRIRERSVLGVAESIVADPNESAAAKAYAQRIVDSMNAG